MRYLVMLALCAGMLSAGGKAWLNLGHMTITQEYDSAGNTVDYPYDGRGSFLNLRLGGKYALPLALPVEFSLGGNLGLSQHSYSDTLGKASSGFALQYFSPFLMFGAPFVEGILGYQLDLGPESKIDTISGKETVPNTDEQNALFLGIWGNFSTPTLGVSAGVSYIFTMENEGYDNGDFIILKGNGSYNFGLGDAGLALLYRVRTDASYNGTTFEGSGGNQLSIYPFVNLSLPGFPVKFSLKLATDDEYYDYGFSLMGKNDFVTRLGFTLGVSYSF